MSITRCAAAGALLLAAGCAQNVPAQYQWNANGTAAAFIPEPSLPGDPNPQNCQDAPYYWGAPDNVWAWSQTTSTGMMRTCTGPNRHVVNQPMPNNTVATTAPVGVVVPAAVSGLTNGLPAAALLRSANAGGVSISNTVGGSSASLGDVTASVGNVSSSIGSVSSSARTGPSVNVNSNTNVNRNTAAALSSSTSTNTNVNVLHQSQGQHQ